MALHYKDSLFRTLFDSAAALLELYNAIHRTNYGADTEVVVNTLADEVFSGVKNDISFLIGGRLVVLVEHQSTINANMPLRFLRYITRLYEKSVSERSALYQHRLVELARPDFCILYNGLEALPEISELRLSDAFKRAEHFDEVRLELTATVYNVNLGHNADIVGRSKHLKCYAYFVDRARFHAAEARARNPGLTQDEVSQIAVRLAAADCRDADLLADFWEKLTKEDITMLATEWDWKTAEEVWKQEWFEEGVEKGMQRGMQKGMQKGINQVLNLVKKGYSPEEILAHFGK